jgi:hypothetical protein
MPIKELPGTRIARNPQRTAEERQYPTPQTVSHAHKTERYYTHRHGGQHPQYIDKEPIANVPDGGDPKIKKR